MNNTAHIYLFIFLLWIRWTLCRSGHSQDTPAAVARNLFLDVKAIGHWWHQSTAHPGDNYLFLGFTSKNVSLLYVSKHVEQYQFFCDTTMCANVKTIQTPYVYHQDSVEKDRRIRELSASHGNDMQKMETQLCSTRMQLDSVRAEYVWQIQTACHVTLTNKSTKQDLFGNGLQPATVSWLKLHNLWLVWKSMDMRMNVNLSVMFLTSSHPVSLHSGLHGWDYMKHAIAFSWSMS